MNHICDCPLGRFCEKHGYNKTRREREICSGVNVLESDRRAWITAWESGTLPGRVAAPALSSSQIRGVGDVVKNVISASAKAITGRPPRPCGGCRDRGAVLNHYLPLQSPPAPLKTPLSNELLVKHFIFHMLPLKGEHDWVWRRAVSRIRAVLPRFNGRVVVAIATHSAGSQRVRKYGTKMELCIESPDEVIREFGDDASRIEFMRVQNSSLGEGVSFPGMLERVLSDDPNHVICYAHNKGGTHGEMPIDSAPHLWCDLMWETVVENDSAVAALERGALAGSLMRDGGTGTIGKWHYSGTFFWMRAADVYARNWAYLQKHYGCVEMWPSVHFKRDEVEVLFADNVGETNSTEYWHQGLLPELSKWRSQSTKDLSVGVVIPATGRVSLYQTLTTLQPQLRDGDHVVIAVDDSEDSDAARLAQSAAGAIAPYARVVFTGQRSGDWGAAARTLGASILSTDLVMFVDDDDALKPYALSDVRAVAYRNPGKVLLFKTLLESHNPTNVVWRQPSISYGNVSTQCIVVPKGVPLGQWGTHYAGDCDFIKSTCCGQEIEWRSEILTVRNGAL